MAKLIGSPVLMGSIENFTGYVDDGIAIIRMKSPLDGKRWKRDPKFRGTRRAAVEFGGANLAATEVWRAIPPKMRNLAMPWAYNRVLGAVRSGMQLGTHVAHGWVAGDLVGDCMAGLDLNPEACADWDLGRIPTEFAERVRWRWHVCAIPLEDYALNRQTGRWNNVVGRRGGISGLAFTGDWVRADGCAAAPGTLFQMSPMELLDLAGADADLPGRGNFVVLAGLEVVVAAPDRVPGKRGRPQVEKLLRAACGLRVVGVVRRGVCKKRLPVLEEAICWYFLGLSAPQRYPTPSARTCTFPPVPSAHPPGTIAASRAGPRT